MAGDWIKVEHATLDKPEITRSAELLGLTADATVGLYVRFWVWLDKNLSVNCPDFVRNVSRISLDSSMNCPGFSATLESVGWAKFDDAASTLHVSNAGYHNGQTAKTRAYDQKRKKESRPESVRNFSDKTRTREEKRREDKHIAPQGVRDDVWQAWVQYRGKKLTPQAIALQTRKLKQYEAGGCDPNAVIEQSIANGWSGLFELRSMPTNVAVLPPSKRVAL